MTGLDRDSFAMSEQVRALADKRIRRRLGTVGDDAFEEISRYLLYFIA
jgi:mRNA-degrading endonuclease toxin of MazEF toxin-antitoxin module